MQYPCPSVVNKQAIPTAAKLSITKQISQHYLIFSLPAACHAKSHPPVVRKSIRSPSAAMSRGFSLLGSEKSCLLALEALASVLLQLAESCFQEIVFSAPREDNDKIQALRPNHHTHFTPALIFSPAKSIGALIGLFNRPSYPADTLATAQIWDAFALVAVVALRRFRNHVPETVALAFSLRVSARVYAKMYPWLIPSPRHTMM